LNVGGSLKEQDGGAWVPSVFAILQNACSSVLAALQLGVVSDPPRRFQREP
jgi:hypothetical protein